MKRVVALGCSFTFGQEVLGTAAWVARVDAARPDLEVVNLAYGSYGLDQALLRLRRDGLREQPDEVWLGILPGALLRNVTVWAPALRHWTDVQHLKPRFELDERGELVLRPNPARSLEELVAIVTDQQRFLAAAGGRDAWVRRFPAAYAPRGSSPWHHSAAARLALTLLERTGRDAAPYVRDSRSEVHRLGLALAREIDREARAIGARLLVLILPGRTDVEARADSGESYWQALVDGLRSAGIEVLDLCPAFEAARAHEDDGCWAPGSHYSVKGNQIAAEAFLAHLAERP